MALLALLTFVVMTTLFPGVVGYSRLQSSIPNGDRVPNPCNGSNFWAGVGHRNTMGAGQLNDFGEGFRLNGKAWNATICQQDSDGDGYTNGQELGDPNCTWSPGQTPARVTQLSHPGICDPVGSAKCASKNSWLKNCTSTKFDCPAINDPNVRNFTARFPRTPIPAVETTYMCYKVAVPNVSASDIIAMQPIIDNMKIIHHMLVFGCTDDPADVQEDRPYLCGMGQQTKCSSLIGLWGPGILGQCLNNQLGFRIGPGGIRYIVIQIHWNNPMKETNQTDSSGMTIHYTPQLRPNPGEIVMIGQNYLEIPPGPDEVTFYGKCSASCTSRFTQPMNITSSVLHMHLLGKSGSIILYRKDQTKIILDIVDDYDYNSPTIKEFDPPITVMRGDVIEVKCTFSSKGRNTTTNWGEGTMDEMCYGFFAYYPKIPDFTFCGQWKSVSMCGNAAIVHEKCDLSVFLLQVKSVLSDCAGGCTTKSCADTLRRAMETGCQRNEDVRAFLLAFFPREGYVVAYCAFDQPPASGISNRCPALQGLSYTSILILMAFFVMASRLV